MSIIHIFTSTSYFNLKYYVIYSLALHFHKKKFITSFIKTYPGYISFSTIMSGWISAPSVVPRGWCSAPSYRWLNWKTGSPNIKSLVCAIIFPKRTDTTLIGDSRPTKWRSIKKGTLFYLFPTDILNDIDIWLVGLEHSVKLKAFMMQINIPLNTFPHLCAYKYWDSFLDLENWLIYHTIKYEWSYRDYVKNHGIGD